MFSSYSEVTHHLLRCEQIKVHNMDIATYIIIINYKYVYVHIIHIRMCIYMYSQVTTVQPASPLLRILSTYIRTYMQVVYICRKSCEKEGLIAIGNT